MSRSYKKTPGWTDGSRNHVKFAKRQANKKVRQSVSDLSDGNSYKRLYEQYNIHDYKSLFHSEKELKKCAEKFNNDDMIHQAKMK